MSHEIRTPMNAIVSISRIMAESDLPAAQRENAEVVCQSSESLLNIINDILDFSRVEAGQLEILSRPVEIEPLVANLVRLLDGAARAKEIYLSYRVASNVAPWLRCDPVRLEQEIGGPQFYEQPHERVNAVLAQLAKLGEEIEQAYSRWALLEGQLAAARD